jgi:hypothetical protein
VWNLAIGEQFEIGKRTCEKWGPLPGGYEFFNGTGVDLKQSLTRGL